jgi:hypothetical protein
MLGHGMGNPQVFFPKPLPIPINTIHTCEGKGTVLPQVSAGYLWLITGFSMNIIKLTKIMYTNRCQAAAAAAGVAADAAP